MFYVKRWIAEKVPFAWRIVPMSWFGEPEDCWCGGYELGEDD